MIKVLLIDDEEIITLGLKKLIDWNTLDMEVVGTASNGGEGLERAKELSPDIIITDIKMYEVSGLDFAENYKKLNPRCKFIALSGYSDFSYVKRALEIGFFNYLLKPVDKQELVKVLMSAKDAIDAESAAILESDSESALKKFYKNVLFNQKEEDFSSQVEALGLFGLRFYVYCINCIHNEESFGDYDAAMETLNKLLNNLAYGTELKYSVISVKDCIVLILAVKSLNYLKTGSELFEELNKACLTEVGIGGEADGVTSLKKAYAQAKEALDNVFFFEPGAVSYEQVLRMKSNINSNAVNFEKRIIDYVAYSSEEDVSKLAHSQIEYFLSVSGGMKENIYNACYELYLKIKDVLVAEGFEVNRGNVYNEITSCRTLYSLEAWLKEEIDNSFEAMAEIKKDRQQDIVEIAKEYLRTHYNEQITIDLLAKKLFVSPTYFCYLFKNKTGIGYHEYILSIRMQEAIKLIATQKYKVYEVAEKVGFSNSRYFSEVFKKHFGFIPTEFDINQHKNLIK